MGYTAGAYPCFNDVKRLGSCHSPWPERQCDAGHLPRLMAGTHLQPSQLKQREAMSLSKGLSTRGFELRCSGSSTNTLTGRLRGRLRVLLYF